MALSRFGYSEDEMAEAFQKIALRPKGLPGIGVLGSVYREISCRQGRPDFIALTNKGTFLDNKRMSNIGLVGAWILATLKPTSPRTYQYLIKKSEYKEASIRKALNTLVSMAYIKQNGNGSYVLGDFTQFLETDVWAFELKLSNPKRAIFQAQQYKSFAERTVIIIPLNQAKNYTRFEKTMKRWGIGLATFDPFTGEFNLLKRPVKTKPFSKEHYMYAILQLLTSDKISN